MNDQFYVDEFLRRKRARRRRLAQLSFEEKIEIIERLRELRFNRDLMSARRVNSEGEIKDDGNRRDALS
ncbi:MAG TPA: hypothetical protein VJ842_13800 [Pyrinomonadaceae bacterium]|nr:hypothetical protein [Pyrinomonadaceae bacterium]